MRFSRLALITALFLSVLAVWSATSYSKQNLTGLLVTSIYARLKLMRDVAAYKSVRSLSVDDPVREHEVVLAAKAQAKRSGLNPRKVGRAIRIQIDVAKNRQRCLMKRWRGKTITVNPNFDLKQVRSQIDLLTRNIVSQLSDLGKISDEEVLQLREPLTRFHLNCINPQASVDMYNSIRSVLQ